MAESPSIDQLNNVDIKTRSIEQTLLPLVKQISTLVTHRERPFCSERSVRALARVGQAVNLAIERFVTVGETIADDNPEIKCEMYQACKDARSAGTVIENLCETAFENSRNDRSAVVRAARCLLSSVTRVLLLADSVVVKQLLHAKEKVSRSLGRLENVTNFTEFVKAFSQFGSEMVELAHLTGDRQNDLKDERRKAQMSAARQVLERSTMLLLISSKTCLRHPDSSTAKENRTTVFCQMRRAIDLIHYVVKDGVWEGGGATIKDEGQTLSEVLRNLDSLIEMTRLTLTLADKDSLNRAVDMVIDRTQDFTDSAYTTHEHRENIILLCERIKIQLEQLVRIASGLDQCEGSSPTHEMELAVTNCLDSTRELRTELLATAKDQTNELPSVIRTGNELVTTITNCAASSDHDLLDKTAIRFQETVDHIAEITKLLRHLATNDNLQVTAKHAEINLKIYAPQVVAAAHTLAQHPSSKIAKENFEVFADMWQSLTLDISAICKEVMERQKVPEKQTYMSLPRPGKHGTTNKPLKSVRLDVDEQEKIAKAGLEMKLATTEMEAETERWKENGGGAVLEENNDIVKRAKNMSSMAFSMYQFTKGEGALRTTQDLFTQAEYFAEEANRLYKVVRQFSYQVPVGTQKKELLEQLDQVPTHVQQLQFTVKNPTVGKAATFTKVDSVINETKTLMNVISKVVTTCFICATQYNLDFNVLANRAGSGQFRDGEDGSGAGGVGSDGKLNSGSGSDASM
ncbi:alpha-catulin isoform X2 [Planococcus citri]